MVRVFLAWLASALLALLKRQATLDVEAIRLEEDAERTARLRAKAAELKAAGHEDLANALLQKAATLGEMPAGLLPGEGIAQNQPTALPAPSPNGTTTNGSSSQKKKPGGRPKKIADNQQP